jgi:ribosomal protein S8
MKKPEWPEITEEHAREMLYIPIERMGEDVLTFWKEEGYIKKSALEEARDHSKNVLGKYYAEPLGDTKGFVAAHEFIKVIDLYEKAIEEIKGNSNG